MKAEMHVNINTKKLANKLTIISKHLGAMAEELNELDQKEHESHE